MPHLQNRVWCSRRKLRGSFGAVLPAQVGRQLAHDVQRKQAPQRQLARQLSRLSAVLCTFDITTVNFGKVPELWEAGHSRFGGLDTSRRLYAADLNHSCRPQVLRSDICNSRKVTWEEVWKAGCAGPVADKVHNQGREVSGGVAAVHAPMQRLQRLRRA